MRRIHALPAVGAIAASLLLAGCAGGSTPAETETADDRVLDMAFSADMATPDPDTQYQIAGNSVMLSLYEGLLEYAPDSTTEIVGRLAESWEVSEDGLTYTFTLRDGLTFADGTDLDSEALLAGFERRANEDVGSPMSYMLLPVDSYDTPDPQTFVIELAYPESAFLSYLASPFSPKAINPAVLDEHADDDALEYLQTASAGSGPYVLSEFALGDEYVLERNENYWGDAPWYDEVRIRIMPDAASQVLALQQGDLDLVFGQPIATVQTFEGSDDVSIQSFPALQKTWIELNPGRTPTDDPAYRDAFRSAIDRDALVAQVWADYGSVSTGMYPTGMLADGLAPDEWTPDTSALADLADGTELEIGYTAGAALEQQVAETVQTQLDAAGVTSTVVPVQEADFYDYSGDLSTAPHMLVQSSFPDSTHPDTWARLFWYHDVASGYGGFLNYFLSGSDDTDARIDEGLGGVDADEVEAIYAEVGEAMHDEATWITLNDTQDVFLTDAGMSGFEHWLPAPNTLDLAALTEE